MKKLSNKFFMVLAALLAGPMAMAQNDFTTIAGKAESALKDTLNPLINIVSILVALIGVVMLIWNFVKRSKSDGQSNDALVSWGVSLIFVFVALQVIKAIFL